MLLDRFKENYLSKLNEIGQHHPIQQKEIFEILQSKNWVTDITLGEAHTICRYLGESTSNPLALWNMFNEPKL